MKLPKRARLISFISGCVVFLVLLVWYLQSVKRANAGPVTTTSSSPAVASSRDYGLAGSPDSALTNIYAHNLMLRKGPGFRVYVPWLRGEMVRLKRSINPSFDDPDTFALEIKSGVIHTNVGDLTNFLDDALAKSSLRNVALSGDGDQINVRGTLHNIVPLPIEMIATISVAPANHVAVA